MSEQNLSQQDPYQTPSAEPKDKDDALNSSSHSSAPLIGCGVGGCLIPFVLFLIAMFSGDIGGPLFWPILCAFTGVIGFFIGLLIKNLR